MAPVPRKILRSGTEPTIDRSRGPDVATKFLRNVVVASPETEKALVESHSSSIRNPGVLGVGTTDNNTSTDRVRLFYCATAAVLSVCALQRHSFVRECSRLLDS